MSLSPHVQDKSEKDQNASLESAYTINQTLIKDAEVSTTVRPNAAVSEDNTNYQPERRNDQMDHAAEATIPDITAPSASRSIADILLSHPEIFNSILSLTDPHSLTQLLPCCKPIYGIVAEALYTDIIVTSDQYHRVFTGAHTKRDYKSKRDLLGYTRSIRVEPRSEDEEYTRSHRDYKSVHGMMPNLRSLTWAVDEVLPELVYVYTLDRLVIRTSRHCEIPLHHRNITIITERPGAITISDRPSPHSQPACDTTQDKTLLTIVFPPCEAEIGIIRSFNYCGEDWLDLVCEIGGPVLQTATGGLRLVGFNMLQAITWDDPAGRPKPGGVPKQIVESLESWFREQGLADRLSSREIREKTTFLSYADWMAEGSRLRVFKQEEQTALLAAESKLMGNRGSAT